MDKINIKEKLNMFNDNFSPKIIEEMDDYYIKLAKLEGEFIRHTHKHNDETFIVLEGFLGIEFDDKTIELSPGEMIVIPNNTAHKPIAKHKCSVLLIEKKNTINTGEINNNLTIEDLEWI